MKRVGNLPVRLVNSGRTLRGKNYLFSILEGKKLVNIYSCNGCFMLYTKCTTYLLKYLQRILGTNPAN